MIKKLYLMRHGETLFNVLKKVQGACDSPLTEKGIQQAKLARDFFQENGIKFDHLYASTQERACDTLEIISESKEYQRLKGLKEMNHGLYEGEPQFLQPDGAEYFETFYSQFGGESLSAVQKRMSSTLQHIMALDDHQQVLAVSHNGACVSFLQTLQQENKDELIQAYPNCAIFIFNYMDKQFELVDIIDPVLKVSIYKSKKQRLI